MGILNYLFIGTAFTLIIDLLLGMKHIKKYKALKEVEWGMSQRILCILVWPLGALVFLINFIKQFFKK